MSARFIAHVERPDGRVHHIDCDAAHENDAGRLSLTVNTYIGAIAAYAPGAWASYRLEAAPEPVTREQVERGEKSVNDFRRHLGMPPFPEDEPFLVPADTPALDERVHVWLREHGCRPGVVDGHVTDQPTGGNVIAIRIKLDERTDDCSHRITPFHDESRQTSGSWHWPHDDEPDDAAGIRATHCVTFQPEEIRAIRVAARSAGATVTTWLHDLAVANTSVPIPPRIEINFEHTAWTSGQMDQFVREFTKRIQRQPPRQH